MRPYQHLPMKFPRDFDPGPKFFFENFAMKFVPDMIQMMNTGIHIDDKAVEKLRKTIDEVQAAVHQRLSNNFIIKKYQKSRLPAAQKEHEEKATQAVRDPEYYVTRYRPGDITHRTWVVNTYLRHLRRNKDCRDKWTISDLKKYNIFLKDHFLAAIIEKRALTENTHVLRGIRALAEYKAMLWNKPRYEKAKEPVELDPFNPGSNKQVTELFKMLNIEPLAFSVDTGAPSWGRKQIEEVKATCEDADLNDVLEAMIDNSFSAIIKNNFIKAFDTYTVDGVLHGNITIFGAKSFRNTSNSPNLLNAPSTGSIYAKPLKKCFVPGNNRVIYAADLSALEDRVIANLSDDQNKINVFLENIDGHSLNACGYYPDAIEKLVGKHKTTLETVRAFMAKVEEGDPLAGSLRQSSKGPTFKLAYGGFPDDDKGGVITKDLFDNYHGVLYPGITDYRENYVLKTTQKQGYIHLGLGCRIYSDDARNEIRTLHNATVQFWSILTLIAINELNHRIRQENLVKEIQITSTIYDSIYTSVVRDAEVLQWLNNNLIEVMTVDYLVNQKVPNEAVGEIGPNWAELYKLSNNAPISEIESVLTNF